MHGTDSAFRTSKYRFYGGLKPSTELNLEYLISGAVLTAFAFAFMFYESGQILSFNSFAFDIQTIGIPIFATGIGTMITSFFRQDKK